MTNFIIFNPENKPIKELPTIYGFNNTAGNSDWNHGHIIAEDGTYLGGHICSNERFMLGDLGIIDGWQNGRHERFKSHYPSGYKMDFVPARDVLSHEGLKKAIHEHRKNNDND
jgi:hypothetical protein